MGGCGFCRIAKWQNYNTIKSEIKPHFDSGNATLVYVKYLILENIRSAYNVGAMFRTADGAGVSKIFLIGYTPAPTDRFGRIQSEIKKTSLGASESVPWEHHLDAQLVIEQLQAEGVSVIALEQADNAVSLTSFIVPEKVAYVVGNEVDGVSDESLRLVEQVVYIPMWGTKESLNVSVATGIILYHGMAT